MYIGLELLNKAIDIVENDLVDSDTNLTSEVEPYGRDGSIYSRDNYETSTQSSIEDISSQNINLLVDYNGPWDSDHTVDDATSPVQSDDDKYDCKKHYTVDSGSGDNTVIPRIPPSLNSDVKLALSWSLNNKKSIGRPITGTMNGTFYLHANLTNAINYLTKNGGRCCKPIMKNLMFSNCNVEAKLLTIFNLDDVSFIKIFRTGNGKILKLQIIPGLFDTPIETWKKKICFPRYKSGMKLHLVKNLQSPQTIYFHHDHGDNQHETVVNTMQV